MVASPTPAATHNYRSVLIYDGDCGFCTVSALWISRRLGSQDSIVPSHTVDLDALGLTLENVLTAAYWVDAEGALHRGHLGVAAALKDCGQPWRATGIVLSTPPISWIASVAYKLIAKYRHRLPGATDACKIDP